MIGKIVNDATAVRCDDGRLVPLSYTEQQHGWKDGTQVSGFVTQQANGHLVAYGLTRHPPTRQAIYVDPVTGNRYVNGKRK